MGVRGAALAHIISQYVIAAILLCQLTKQIHLLPPSIKHLQFGRFLKNGHTGTCIFPGGLSPRTSCCCSSFTSIILTQLLVFLKSLIPLPCSNIYGLMNLKEKLIMVGGIDGPPGERSIIGFSIWLLEGKDWQLISRITNHCFQRCGDSFDSSCADDLIYIHGNHLPLLVFDMNLKQWRWCQKFPMKDVYNGFRFQPRLDISPYSRRELTSSKRFLWDVSQTVSQKPWFFKFIFYSENEPKGYAYDPILQKWQRMDFPNIIDSYQFCDSSDGLVCYIKDHAIFRRDMNQR